MDFDFADNAIIRERVIQVFEPSKPHWALYHCENQKDNVEEIPVNYIAVVEIEFVEEGQNGTGTELWPVFSEDINSMIMNPLRNAPRSYFGFYLEGDQATREHLILLGIRRLAPHEKTRFNKGKNQ